MKEKLTASCGCHMGRVRFNNEDNFCFDQQILPIINNGLEEPLYAEYNLEKEPPVFGVFDGMGGEEDGQIASFFSAGILLEWCEKYRLTEENIEEFYKTAIETMNIAVYKEAEKQFNRMGSTAAMVCFDRKQMYLCNLGDSRIYRLREGELQQLSKDHTDAEMLKKHGITNRKPKLTQCIGISPEEMCLDPYIASSEWQYGDQYLICSDGLTDMVTIEEICNTMSETEDTVACVKTLIDKALKGGGRDNITVIVIRLESE